MSPVPCIVACFSGVMKAPRYLGIRASVMTYNTWVLALSSLGMFFALYLILRHQLKSRAST